MLPVSLEESIGIENEIRTIDFFVNSLDLAKMGSKVCFPEGERSDVGFIFIAFNIKRVSSLMGKKALSECMDI